MDAFNALSTLIGPVFWALLPISSVTLALILYTFYCILLKEEISGWVEVFLAHFKETATLLGLLGSVYALTSSFKVEGASVAEIREKMFFILSTGFWSTIAGVLVSLEASIGLLAMKKT